VSCPSLPRTARTANPPTGHLNIEITTEVLRIPGFPVNVYEGPIEDGRLVRSDCGRSISLQLRGFRSDRSYAVTARYLVGQDTVARDRFGRHHDETKAIL
jgi:hypothetical protein